MTRQGTTAPPTPLLYLVVAAVVIAGVTLTHVSRGARAIRDCNDTRGLAEVKNDLAELGVKTLSGILEVCNEPALVPAGVINSNRVAVDIKTTGQVVHDELPLATEVAVGEGHHRIDLSGVTHPAHHRSRMPDEAGLDWSVDVGVIHLTTNAAGGSNVGVREHTLDRSPVLHLESRREQVGTNRVVTDLAHPAILVILGSSVEIVETPLVAKLAVALDKIPEGFHVGHKLKHRWATLGHLANGTTKNLRMHTPLKHLGCQLGRGQRRQGDIDQVARAGVGERREAACTASNPVIASDSERLSLETIRNDVIRGIAEILHDVSELLFRTISRKNLVEAEQVSPIRLLLETVRIPSVTNSDGYFGRITGSSNTSRGIHVSPRPRKVRVNAVETVERVSGSVLSRKRPGLNVANPRIQRTDVLDDFLVKMLRTPREKVGKLPTGQ